MATTSAYFGWIIQLTPILFTVSFTYLPKFEFQSKWAPRGQTQIGCLVSSTSYVLDRGIWPLNDSVFVLYGEEDEACTKADDVTGANWAPVHGSCSSKGGRDMGYSFNRGERVGEWGGHDHAGRSCGLGGYGGGRGNDCFKCGVTGHMAS